MGALRRTERKGGGKVDRKGEEESLDGSRAENRVLGASSHWLPENPLCSTLSSAGNMVEAAAHSEGGVKCHTGHEVV